MPSGQKYKVYGIPDKSLREYRMGSQFEVEPDQKFRIPEEEIQLKEEEDKEYEREREQIFMSQQVMD